MDRRGRSASPRRTTSPPPHMAYGAEDDSLLDPRQIEAFGRTVHATASHLISTNFPNNGIEPAPADHYRSALSSLHRHSRRPVVQRSVFSFAKASPRELIRNNFDTDEIEHRAVAFLPDELIRTAPQSQSPYSLFEGFKASLPESERDPVGRRKKHGRHASGKGRKQLEGVAEEDSPGTPRATKLRREKDRLDHRLEMMGIRKTMCASEIKEIDGKLANLNAMRKAVLERLAGLEQEEHDLEMEVREAAEKLEDLQELQDDEAASAAASAAAKTPSVGSVKDGKASDHAGEDAQSDVSAGFMSESIYEKLPRSKDALRSKRKANRLPRRKMSMPVLHEHMEPGSQIRELQAHNDIVTALDFDAPFGTMVTAALDDTVRVWDLNAGRCMGLLEGHLSSVRCLQVEDHIVATGSMDASIRLWDLSQADYNPQRSHRSSVVSKQTDLEDSETDAETAGGQPFTPTTSEPEQPQGDAMADCHMFTLSAHVAEITALTLRGNTLVSGSADKTLRQWDLEKGRCVQTLDVLWAAAQASAVSPSFNSSSASSTESPSWWRPTQGRIQTAEADFVGALQVFDAALACGTADGMVRLWDLRSGMVHRSLVGHTGPVTALQFDDVYLVTGSQDRSIRVWDLRTGGIHDAYAYDHPVTSMMFDTRRIVAAAGEDVVKVYDKEDGRQWDCGAGALVTNGEPKPSIVEKVRIRDGYLVEGRKDGVVGVWSC